MNVSSKTGSYWILLCFVFVLSCQRFSEEEQASLDRGKEIYLTHCISCHGPEGDGMSGAYPSLTKNKIEQFHTQRAVNLIVKGSGFESGMRPIALSDEEIADVVNYIQNSWDNEADFIHPTAIKDF